MSGIGKIIDVLDDVAKLIGWATSIEAAVARQQQAAAEIRALADKLQAEGRKTLTAEEWASIAEPAMNARDALADRLRKDGHI